MRADRVLQLRELLDKLGSTSGLITEEKGIVKCTDNSLVFVLNSYSYQV